MDFIKHDNVIILQLHSHFKNLCNVPVIIYTVMKYFRFLELSTPNVLSFAKNRCIVTQTSI
jgi:hypothetical protein